MDNEEKNKEPSRKFAARLFVKGKCYAFNEQLITQASLNDNESTNKTIKRLAMKKRMVLSLRVIGGLLTFIMILLMIYFIILAKKF